MFVHSSIQKGNVECLTTLLFAGGVAIPVRSFGEVICENLTDYGLVLF